MLQLRNSLMLARVSMTFAALSANGLASVIVAPPTAFPAGSPLIDFNGFASGTEVNGLAAGGVSFTYTVSGSPLNGAVVIDGGPGVTNNINPPNIVSVGNNTGTLTVTLPSLENLFGYGFAILFSSAVANATTISLFNGAAPVGSLSYSGAPDPVFTGGFAGIDSSLPFNRVELTFNSSVASAFAVDNIRFAAVSETTTFRLLLLGAFSLSLAALRRAIWPCHR